MNRAKRACRGLRHWTNQGHNLQDAIIEQVTDLMQLCHNRGYSFAELADAAYFQHRDELNHHLVTGELEHAGHHA